MASQITSVSSVHSTVLSGVDQRKHRNSTPLAHLRGIHRSPVNSHHKGKVTRTMFSFDDVMMDNFEVMTRQRMLPFTSRMRRDDINSQVQFKSLIEFVMQINCPVSDKWRLHKWHLKITGIVCRLALKYSSVIEIYRCFALLPSYVWLIKICYIQFVYDFTVTIDKIVLKDGGVSSGEGWLCACVMYKGRKARFGIFCRKRCSL